jgi:trk system potassium uptake protein
MNEKIGPKGGIMNVLIVGGGRTGFFLGQVLAKTGHCLTIVERRHDASSRLSADLPFAKVVVGDGTLPRILHKADAHKADAVAAVTDVDKDNIMVSLLVHKEFNAPLVIARVNNPKNAWLFTKQMGVDVALDQVSMLGRLIQEEISLGEIVTLLKLGRGELTLLQERLTPVSAAVGKQICDLRLPPDTLLIAIFRHGRILVPRGATILNANDQLIAIARTENMEQLAEKLR